jgi:hypothetical protein
MSMHYLTHPLGLCGCRNDGPPLGTDVATALTPNPPVPFPFGRILLANPPGAQMVGVIAAGEIRFCANPVTVYSALRPNDAGPLPQRKAVLPQLHAAVPAQSAWHSPPVARPLVKA